MNLKRNNVSKQGTTLNNLLISMQTSDSVSAYALKVILQTA